MKHERRDWTDEERERVFKMACGDMSTQEIAATFNRTENAIARMVHDFRKEGRHIPARYKRPREQEVVREIPAREIADKLNAFWKKQVAWVDHGRLVTCLVGGKPIDSVRR